jgi:hypothetical protein
MNFYGFFNKYYKLQRKSLLRARPNGNSTTRLGQEIQNSQEDKERRGGDGGVMEVFLDAAAGGVEFSAASESRSQGGAPLLDGDEDNEDDRYGNFRKKQYLLGGDHIKIIFNLQFSMINQ